MAFCRFSVNDCRICAMHRDVCPYCKEDLADFNEGYCPYCGAVLNLSTAEQRNSEIELLLLEAKAALDREEWHEANQKLIAVLRRYPRHRKARELLEVSHQEQKLWRLYSLAQYHRKGKRWEKAIDYLLQIEELRPNYKDSARLIEVIEKEKWLEKHDPRRQKRADNLVRAILAIMLLIYLCLLAGAIAVLLFSPGGILAR